MTRACGVVGFPLGHSISPRFQQPAFDELGLDVHYRAYETPPEALETFFAGLRSDAWLGCNVTIPHKRSALDLVDTVSDEARLIGAVNTVVREAGGRLSGHNTDAGGFVRALVEDAGYQPRGEGAVLLGAGGAALAVAVALLRAGASRLWIANRTPARAGALVARLEAGFGAGRVVAAELTADGLRAPLEGATLLVNSTSVGMAHGPDPAGTPLPPELIGAHLLVYDLVYNPSQTPLLRAARAAGARMQAGLPMLIYQGALAFERWTGRPAPVETMLRHGRLALGD